MFFFLSFLNKVQGAAMWARLGGVHVAGWILSILSTAAIAKAAQAGGDSVRLACVGNCGEVFPCDGVFPVLAMYGKGRM